MDMSELKTFLKCWERPKLDPSYRNYVKSVMADLWVFFSVENDTHTWILFSCMYFYGVFTAIQYKDVVLPV